MCSSSLGIFFYADIMEYYKNLQIEDIFYFDDDGISQIEQWKDIPDYVEIYQASDLGRIKSLSRFIDNGRGGYISKEKMLRSNIDRDGYLLVSLCKNGIPDKLKRHRIVAQVFIPNPFNLPDVNHTKIKENGECDKTDNRVVSLEWSSKADNVKHSTVNGLVPRGERHHNTKLTDRQVLEIRASDLTHRELYKMYGVSRPTITKIINRQRWTCI